MKRRYHTPAFAALAVMAPLNDQLPPAERKKAAIELSDLVTRIVTYVICHTIVDHEALLGEERMSTGHAFLQRVTTTHICNHKLTAEGIALEYEGQSFLLHEEYKTMTLTRSVYEHLAMFYFLYEHPKTDDERTLVWNYWKVNSKKNLLNDISGEDTFAQEEQQTMQKELEELRREILSSPLGKQHFVKLADWTRPDTLPHNGSIEFFTERGKPDVCRVSYSQAWKYLYHSEDMALIYRHLSMHCHPVHSSLVQYQNQPDSDEGDDAVPLYLSSSFLAYLCRLFLKTIPDGKDMLRHGFTERELSIFQALSRLH